MFGYGLKKGMYKQLIMRWKIFFWGLLVLPVAVSAQTSDRESTQPGWNIKTNLLYDATTTLNMGVEFRTGRSTSIDIPLNYNPWTFRNNRKWKHILVQPEFRLWPRESFDGHFFGLHAHYAFYNTGRLPHGPFSQNMAASRYQGWAAGAGVSYGYRWNFGDSRWAMEATIGVGYAYLDYDKYECNECSERLKSDTRNYFGPTKIGLSLVYNIGKKKTARTTEPVYVPAPIVIPPRSVVYEPQFVVSRVKAKAESVTEHHETGKAYLDFAVGRSEIMPSFKNNATELWKLDELIESVKAKPDTTITRIIITGYTSPEANYDTNLALSERRASALTNYIRTKYGLPASIFTVAGAGEDWAGLDSLVSRSYMPRRDVILDIIRNVGIFAGRESDLMRLDGGGPYRIMKAEMFPLLRRVEYEIYYTVHSSALKTNDDTANLNAAADALSRKDAASAMRYLNMVEGHTASRMNNMAILAFMQGDTDRAAEYFAAAEAAGSTHAAANAKELEKYIQSNTNL